MNNKEIWKDIKGFEDYYQVSNKGRVKSLKRKRFNRTGYLKEKVLTNNKVGKDKKYYSVVLFKEGKKKAFKVHILVAECFLNYKNNKQKGFVVDHIDNNSLNNDCSNLQIITQRENCNKDKKSTSKYYGVRS